MKDSLTIAGCSVIAFFLIAITGMELLPVQASQHYGVTALHLPPGKQDSLLTRLGAWDSVFYARIAQKGYLAGDDTTAFYPLWPLLLRVGSAISRLSPIVVGLILSNLCFLGMIPLMISIFDEAERNVPTGSGISGRYCNSALLMFVCYPGSLFLNVPYTESLFLLLATGLLYAMQHQRMGIACIAAFLAPLARPVGCLLLIPILYWLFSEPNWRKRLAVPTSLLLGYGGYFVVMQATTGNSLAGFEAQQMFPAQGSLGKLFQPKEFLQSLLAFDSLHSMKGSLLDRAFFMFALFFTGCLYGRNRLLFWYSLPLVVVPAVTNSFFSFTRFAVVAFPVFWQASNDILETGGKPLHHSVCLVFAILKGLLILCFTNYYWAG